MSADTWHVTASGRDAAGTRCSWSGPRQEEEAVLLSLLRGAGFCLSGEQEAGQEAGLGLLPSTAQQRQ